MFRYPNKTIWTNPNTIYDLRSSSFLVIFTPWHLKWSQVRGLQVQLHAEVRAEGNRRNVPAREVHRGRGRFPDQVRVPGPVQRVLRQVDREQPVYVVRGSVAVLQQSPKDGQEAEVHQYSGAVRKNGRKQKIHRLRTSNFIL